jgi:hypothetical protein
MALVYLVFFGVSALNKTGENAISDANHTKEFKKAIKADAPRTINYQVLVSRDQHEAVNDEPARAPVCWFCKKIRFIADTGRINQNFYRHFIFYRPPPVLA